jgi:probable metal-binding protein
MEMMMETGKVYTIDSLRTDIIKRFGESARFYTCSAEDMTPDQLIAFLQARGKFVDAGDGFTTEKTKMCDD